VATAVLVLPWRAVQGSDGTSHHARQFFYQRLCDLHRHLRAPRACESVDCSQKNNQRIHIAAFGWKRIGQKRPLAGSLNL